MGMDALIKKGVADMAQLQRDIDAVKAVLAGPCSQRCSISLADRSAAVAREEADLAQVVNTRARNLERARHRMGVAEMEAESAHVALCDATGHCLTLKEARV
jgi:hypothetical protein